MVCDHLSRVARENPAVRTFALSALSSLIVGEAVPGGFARGDARVVSGFEDLFLTKRLGSSESPPPAGLTEARADGGDGGDSNAPNLFKPLLELLNAEDTALVEEGITNLQSILEKIGQRVDCWPLIIASLRACEGPAAFKCLKFIVDEFLDNVGESSSSEGPRKLIEACESYAFSSFNVNTSLASISLLWSISDRDGEFLLCLESLVKVSGDERPEIRNCAVNTLFSCVASSDGERWAKIFEDVILELIKNLEEKLTNASETQATKGGEEKGFVMRVHHSRDNPRKQWGETYKFGLQGLSRILRHFLPTHPLPASLHSALLKLALHTLSFPTECAQAGVELLLLIVEVLGGGEAQKPPTGVVNGALMHAESPSRSPKSKCE